MVCPVGWRDWSGYPCVCAESCSAAAKSGAHKSGASCFFIQGAARGCEPTLYPARDNLMTELDCSSGQSLSRSCCDDYRSHMSGPRDSVAAIDTKGSRTFGVMEINSFSVDAQTVYCGAATPYGNSYSSVILSRLRKASCGCLFHLTEICVRQ